MGRLAEIHLAAPPSKHKIPLIEQEQEIVTQDLIASADLPFSSAPGPFRLELTLIESTLKFIFTCLAKGESYAVDVPVPQLKKLVKDYAMMVEAYETARAELTPNRIEALDMGRRALHNEGAEIITEAFMAKVDLDQETARRFFTLISIILIGHNAI